MAAVVVACALASTLTGAVACAAPTSRHGAKVDSILMEIDRAVDKSAEYVARKEERIRLKRAELDKAQSPQARYEMAHSLYAEYRPFIKDSALFFLDVCLSAARETADTSRRVLCSAQKAFICSNSGLYTEALDLLCGLCKERITDIEAKCEYYAAEAHVRGEIAIITPLADMRERYGREAAKYRDLLMSEAPDKDLKALMTREKAALDAGDTATSMKVNDLWLSVVEHGSHDYALVTLYRYLEFKAREDTARMLTWLGESVLADIRNGVMDQGSMWEMANQLILMGDVDRAYKYICFTSDCNSRFGSRQRMTSIAPLLTLITQEYKTEADRYQDRQRMAIALVSVLALMLAAGVGYVWRQRNKLQRTRDSLAQRSEALARLNEELTAANTQLTLLNTRHETLNRQLNEANKVKEEYVGRFMSLCSTYVERIDDLRKKVRNKVKASQWADLSALTRTEDFNTDEMENLYANFDAAFLHLYPDFVEQFNALLTPEARISPTVPGRLNTQMRIFALIRLGITDSGKISEILHYSVNTIYNYRAQTKKQSACGKEDFEERVKAINS